jgi:hypothetical protein
MKSLSLTKTGAVGITCVVLGAGCGGAPGTSDPVATSQAVTPAPHIAVIKIDGH